MSRFADKDWSMATFLALVACAALFVLVTGRALPAVVASHFDASGQADGFMPREVYVGLMLALVVGVPLVLAVVQTQAFRRPNARINLPNRDYWLAPERRAETIETLSRQALLLSSMILLFLCYGHWLVVRANGSPRPSLSSLWFVGGFLVFLAATAFWVIALIGRFRNVPPSARRS